MKKPITIILFIGVLLTLFNESASINAECNYGNRIWDAIGEIYRCDVQNNFNISSPNNVTITSVTGNHERGKSNNDVEVFRCVSRNIKYFPKGLEIIFPNLKALSFYDNIIKEVHQSDLKPFPKLETIYLGYNFIEVIEEDLFMFNHNLKYISFSNNNIIHIHPKVFDHLNELKYLYLYSISCMSMYAENNSTAVTEVIKAVKSNCTDTEYQTLSEKFTNLEINYDSLKSGEFNHQLEGLENIFRRSKYSNLSSFRKRIEKLDQIKETKEAKEYKENLPQIVNALEKTSSEFQVQIMEILSNMTRQIEEIKDKKSDIISVLNDYWKVMSVSVLGLLQTIILIVIYNNFSE